MTRPCAALSPAWLATCAPWSREGWRARWRAALVPARRQHAPRQRAPAAVCIRLAGRRLLAGRLCGLLRLLGLRALLLAALLLRALLLRALLLRALLLRAWRLVGGGHLVGGRRLRCGLGAWLLVGGRRRGLSGRLGVAGLLLGGWLPVARRLLRGAWLLVGGGL